MIEIFKSVYLFVKKLLNERNYKRLVLLLIVALLVVIYYSMEKLSGIENKIDGLSKNDSLIQQQNYNRINQMYNDGIAMFQEYTKNQTADLKTIVDYTVNSKKDANLLKNLLEKSLNESKQESQKQQFNRRYIDTTKHQINSKKISFVYPSHDSSLITQLNTNVNQQR